MPLYAIQRAYWVSLGLPRPFRASLGPYKAYLRLFRNKTHSFQHDDYDSCLNCKQKAPLHLNLFGEYFQSIRILFKHCGHNRKNTNKEDCRVKSESEQIEQDCRAESESGQNFGPLSTTPPSPRAPPAGLLPPLQLPGPGDCKAGYLLPGKEQKPVNILPSATSWLQLE